MVLYILKSFFFTFFFYFLYLLVSWAWWDSPLTWLIDHCPSVLWHSWLGLLTRKIGSSPPLPRSPIPRVRHFRVLPLESITVFNPNPDSDPNPGNEGPWEWWTLGMVSRYRKIVPEISYNVSSGTLNPTILYYNAPSSNWALLCMRTSHSTKNSIKVYRTSETVVCVWYKNND